jgi:hypothetical protein
MTKVRNISDGPRGAYTKDGQLIMAEKGQAIDADDFAPEWFAKDDGSDEGGEPGPLDGSVEDLTAYLSGVDDAAAVDELIAAETGGKSRKGALAALEARRAELAGE